MLRPKLGGAENKRVSTVPLTDWLGGIFMSFRGPKALNDSYATARRQRHLASCPKMSEQCRC